MIDIRKLREDPERFREGARRKGFDPGCIEKVLGLDEERRRIQASTDARKKELGVKSSAMKKASPPEREALQAELKEFSRAIKEDEARLREAEEGFTRLLLAVPNPPMDDVPVGRNEADNVELRREGEPPAFGFQPRDHIELGLRNRMLDLERGAKVAGPRSYYLMGDGALLENAVMRYTLDVLAPRGFVPFVTPVLVKEACMVGSGYFPTGREEAYAVERDELFLIGTSEVTLISYHMDEILREEDLPRRYAGLTTCYRREAGSYGKDVKGLYRVHQFQKVEQVVICRDDPGEMGRMHAEILANSEHVVRSLDLPYRVVEVCTGDMGLGQVKKHDIECWMPGRGGYGETHSCSSLGDFQSRRARIRYKGKDGVNRFPFTLNNTAAASPRILIAIMENHQNEDGSITVPEVLVPYMQGKRRIG